MVVFVHIGFFPLHIYGVCLIFVDSDACFLLNVDFINRIELFGSLSTSSSPL
jgi:hypothetical protein